MKNTCVPIYKILVRILTCPISVRFWPARTRQHNIICIYTCDYDDDDGLVGGTTTAAIIVILGTNKQYYNASGKKSNYLHSLRYGTYGAVPS